MVRSLDKKWKELLFAMGSFGPNFMAVLLGAYFSDAINPAALGSNSVQAISNYCLILPLVFPALWFVAKLIDGLIDIPLASITDGISTKFGRRRLPILVCFIPMVVSFAMCWFAIGGTGENANQLLNTIWMVTWAIIFFVSYSMSVITFYGSIASVCTGEAQRSRVTAYKSFFDTISYCIVYALVPLILKLAGVHIHVLVWCMLPLFATIISPVFLIKEGEKYGYPENAGKDTNEYKKVGIWESLKITFSNKLFMKWVIVDCCAIFGLQMFLASMNALIIGGMGFNSGQMALVNTSAFAPVPVMLYLLNKLKQKKGLRFAFQTCLISFALCILSFDAASLYVLGTGRVGLQYLISMLGGLCASWAIGAFFMFPYLVPAQVAGVEKKITGRDHSAMYFAARIVCTTIVGAFGSSLVYDNIKNFFISKKASGVVMATSFEKAAQLFSERSGQVLLEGDVYNLGLLIVPAIVCLACLIGFFVAFCLPRDFDQKSIALALKKQHPEYDITGVEEEHVDEEVGGNVFVHIALWVLSGGIFGAIWQGVSLKSINKDGRKVHWVWFVLSLLIPFVGIYYFIQVNKALMAKESELGLPVKNRLVLYIITSVILPLGMLNVVSLAVMQADLNKILCKEAGVESVAKVKGIAID
ncbi:MAG: MFS transporter [Bacilli bacterium]|nr:MFS transporter [Bacilli bacterium]